MKNNSDKAKKNKEFIDLCSRLYNDLSEIATPEIFTYPNRPLSESAESQTIEKKQREGFLLLGDLLKGYPCFEIAHRMFKKWDSENIEILKQINISDEEIQDYHADKIKDIEYDRQNDIEGLKDIFILFYNRVKNLENLRLVIQGYPDFGKERAMAVFEEMTETRSVSFRSPDDMMNFLKLENRIYSKDKKSPKIKVRIEEKASRIYIGEKEIHIKPDSDYFRALNYLLKFAPIEKKAVPPRWILDHSGSGCSRLQNVFGSKKELWKLFKRNKNGLYYFNEDYMIDKSKR
ncbi:MAG: hypothetical protein GY839_10835 [candidate division Zixibacteria bacterium]|nr:hypothetical protein [candidate division Zixibacteria bacterium]